MRSFALAIFMIFTITASAGADDALTSFNQGDYAAAIRLGDAETTPGGIMAAARAHMVFGGFYEEREAALIALSRAKVLVDKVLAGDENNLEARTTMALILGFQAKAKMSLRGVTRVKKLILETLALHRDSGLAHGALAGWYSEVSAAGILPRIVLGASRRRAAVAFNDALQRSPRDFGLQYQYGKFLSRGNKAERAEAIIVFKGIIAAKSEIAIEKLLQEKSAIILAALHSNSKRKIKKAVKENSAFSVL